jgi:hypothetical protein
LAAENVLFPPANEFSEVLEVGNRTVDGTEVLGDDSTPTDALDFFVETDVSRADWTLKSGLSVEVLADVN